MIHHYDLPGGVPVKCEHSTVFPFKTMRRNSGKMIDVTSLACTRIDLHVPAACAELGIQKREEIAQQITELAQKQGISLPPFRNVEKPHPKEQRRTYSLLLNDRDGTLLPLVQEALKRLSKE